MTIKMTEPATARLIEVFSAIQGEGLNVGTRQIFIRFALCDLRCHFCDSAHTWNVPSMYRVERTPGQRDFETHPNPVSSSQLLEWIEQQNQAGVHDSISLTGGEPLLHATFLAHFLPKLRDLVDLPIYLETGGHRPEQLITILPYLDFIGMDVKLPSVSGEIHWQAHSEFLQLCYTSSVDIFVKIIISSQTDPADLVETAKLVAAVHPTIPVFLQPVTPLNAAELSRMAHHSKSAEDTLQEILAPSPEQVLSWQTLMKRFLKQVRVVPQTHKMLGQL